MAVTQAHLRILADLVLREELVHLVQKGLVPTRQRDGGRVEGGVEIVGRHVRMDLPLYPGEDLRELLSAQRVAVARQLDHAIRPGPERGVAKSPDVETLRVSCVGFRRLRNEALRVLHHPLLGRVRSPPAPGCARVV